MGLAALSAFIATTSISALVGISPVIAGSSEVPTISAGMSSLFVDRDPRPVVHRTRGRGDLVGVEFEHLAATVVSLPVPWSPGSRS